MAPSAVSDVHGGAGEAAALMRAHDWAATSLGPIEDWPQALRTVVRVILAASTPMAVYWGAELVLIYNDAWRMLIGKAHPAAMGQPGAQVLPEIWDSVGPMLHAIVAGEAGTELANQKLSIVRHGSRSDAWFTYNLNPIPRADGSIGGILIVVVETTARMNMEAELLASDERQAFLLAVSDAVQGVSSAQAVRRIAAEMLGRHLHADRVGFVEVEDGGCATVQDDWCAADTPSVAGRHSITDFAPAVLQALCAGRVVTLEDISNDRLTLAHGAATGALAGTRAAIIVPLLRQDRFTAAFFVHARRPRCWSRDEEWLARNVAERTWTAAERTRSETALRESEAYVRLLVESTAEGFYAVDTEGRATHCNPAFLSMLGFASDDQVVGTFLHDIVHHSHPDGSRYPADACPIHRCARDGRPAHVNGEVFYRTDGTPVPVEYWAHPIIRDGVLHGAICTFLDVTERVRAEAALKESESRFRQIADSAPVPMWVTRSDGKRSFINLAYARFLDVSYDEALEYDWRLRIHPDDLPRLRVEQVEKEAALQPFTLEARYLNGASEWRWLRSESQPRFDASGRAIGFIGAAYDITMAKQAAIDLQLANDTLEARIAERTQERDRVWALSRDLLVIVDSAGIFRAVNPAWRTILGHDPADVMGRGFADFVLPEDKAATQDGLVRALAADDLTNFVNRYRHKDGSLRWLSWHTSVAGRLVYGYGRDITSEKRQAEALVQAEAALRQSQKMEAIGQMTGGVAHDFNNLLQGISGALEMLSRKHVQSAEAHKLLRLAGGAVERGAHLTKHLLAFARKQQLATQPTDVSAVVVAAVALLTGSLGAGTLVDTALADGLWLAMTDPSQLDVAVVNLVLNARDAMPGGGTITITAQNLCVPPGGAAGLAADLPPGDYIRLSVADTGHGIPEAIRARVFEPFFTTKTIGKGTGLGLAQVHGFAHQSGGSVGVASTPGGGTTFEIFLPRAFALPSPVEESAPAEWRGSETVLVVDDDTDVRDLAVACLKDCGYRVLAADGGSRGLEILDQDNTVDLLLVDYMMPGMSGAECVRMARRMRPDLRVIFMTGFADLEAVAEHVGPTEIIYKPFKLASLAERVGSALATPPREPAPQG